eukprot:1142519-Pelagomonas_calceolata.AAC.2
MPAFEPDHSSPVAPVLQPAGGLWRPAAPAFDPDHFSPVAPAVKSDHMSPEHHCVLLLHCKANPLRPFRCESLVRIGDVSTLQESYARMSRALNATGRPILFSLCSWGTGKPWLWGNKVRVITLCAFSFPVFSVLLGHRKALALGQQGAWDHFMRLLLSCYCCATGAQGSLGFGATQGAQDNFRHIFPQSLSPCF